MAKQRRKTWTDAEREELILEIEGLPEGMPMSTVAHKRGINPGWLRKMRERYLKEHPTFLELAAKRVPAVKPEPAIDFRQADKETKKKLLAEYDTLPLEKKQEFRERYNLTQQLVGYYRMRLLNKVYKRGGKMSQLSPEQREAMLKEYLAITASGGKKEWLERHGLNHQNIFDMKKKVLRAPANKQVAIKTIQPHFIPISPAPQHTTSLDDAIAAFEVKQDILKGFIEELKRMRGPRQ